MFEQKLIKGQGVIGEVVEAKPNTETKLTDDKQNNIEVPNIIFIFILWLNWYDQHILNLYTPKFYKIIMF